MHRRTLLTSAGSLATVFGILGRVGPVRAQIPGVTATEIKIGQTEAYSGPASAYGAIGRGLDAFFKQVNDRGGVAGRKINFISVDDGYLPPKAVEQTRRLVEQEGVSFMLNGLGTPSNSAVQRYLNQKVPVRQAKEGPWCESAVGFGADQRDKTLKRLASPGSRARTDTQPPMVRTAGRQPPDRSIMNGLCPRRDYPMSTHATTSRRWRRFRVRKRVECHRRGWLGGPEAVAAEPAVPLLRRADNVRPARARLGRRAGGGERRQHGRLVGRAEPADHPALLVDDRQHAAALCHVLHQDAVAAGVLRGCVGVHIPGSR